MEKYIVEATKSTPKVSLNPLTHRHEFSGESYPENCSVFYSPILTWCKEYLPKTNGETVRFSMDILYFNSSSSKSLMELFEMLDVAASTGTNVVVDWRYHADNEVALECGEDFMDELESVTFNLVSYN